MKSSVSILAFAIGLIALTNAYEFNVTVYIYTSDESCDANNTLEAQWTYGLNTCTQASDDGVAYSEMFTCANDTLMLQTFSDTTCNSTGIASTVYETSLYDECVIFNNITYSNTTVFNNTLTYLMNNDTWGNITWGNATWVNTSDQNIVQGDEYWSYYWEFDCANHFTNAPTAAPTTSEPTFAPTTSQPSAAPVTSMPSAAPVTSAPSAAPSTTPSASPTASTAAPTTSPTPAGATYEDVTVYVVSFTQTYAGMTVLSCPAALPALVESMSAVLGEDDVTATCVEIHRRSQRRYLSTDVSVEFQVQMATTEAADDIVTAVAAPTFMADMQAEMDTKTELSALTVATSGVATKATTVIQVVVTPAPTSAPTPTLILEESTESEEASLGGPIGGAVGGVFFLVVVFLLCYYGKCDGCRKTIGMAPMKPSSSTEVHPVDIEAQQLNVQNPQAESLLVR